MVERVKPKVGGGGAYFSSPKAGVPFVPSGCKILDLALGGGWAEGRISNIIGDKATGKSLLCIEACANFALKYPKGRIKYREAEAAFDPAYAAALGMPVDRVDFGKRPLETVEDLFEDLNECMAKTSGPELYICDSLDALSDRAEMGRTMDEGTYGTEKARKMSQLFRRVVRDMKSKKLTFIIVSQVRSKIGLTFGRTTTRTGGRALDFYASQVVYLAVTGMIPKTISGVERTIGIKVKAKVDKCKVGLPFREAAFAIMFGYGVDDAAACLMWLAEAGGLRELRLTEKGIKEYLRDLARASTSDFAAEMADIHKVVERRWWEVEKSFLPARKKYGGQDA